MEAFKTLGTPALGFFTIVSSDFFPPTSLVLETYGAYSMHACM